MPSFYEDDDDDWERIRQQQREEEECVVSSCVQLMILALKNEEDTGNLPRPKKRRTRRRAFDAHAAHHCLVRDHIGRNPLFGKEFKAFFRLSRARVEQLFNDFGAYSEVDPFYQSFRVDKFGRVGSSMEVKILLPLRTIAYGVAPHTFCDYFQVSKPMAREIYKQFIYTFPHLYQEEYLRLPTERDLQNITALHQRQHGVPGMVGSLDCMQTKWKNCPLGWQQSFKGRSKGMSTIVMEAACDYNLWFWHAAYGFSGSLNDCNILSLSPLLDRMTNGSFTRLEKKSKVVPFFVESEVQGFNNTYFLVDGIYPRYTQFVKAFAHPIGEEEQRFTAWQEGARKDIERAFGVLQCRFKAIATPIHLMDQDCIYKLATTCLIACPQHVCSRKDNGKL